MKFITAEQGVALAHTAETWVGTPFVFGACSKGHGVDCARLISGAAKENGLVPAGYQPPKEHADWIYGKRVDRDVFVRELKKYCGQIQYDDRRPGDIVSFYFNGIESHVGIIAASDMVVHAAQDREVIVTALRHMRNICALYRILIDGIVE